MKDKQNDISRRNRSIRLLKLYNKWSFDLTKLDNLSEESISKTIVEKIIGQSKNEITLLKPNMNDKDSMEISKKLTDLSRNLKGIEEVMVQCTIAQRMRKSVTFTVNVSLKIGVGLLNAFGVGIGGKTHQRKLKELIRELRTF